VSDASDHFHFAVTYGDDEVRAYGKLIAARRARGQDSGMFLGMLFGAIPAIGLAGLGAFKLGWIGTAAVPPVLVTAYAAFAAGWASYWLLVRRYFRTLRRAEAHRGPWNYAFGDDGILYKNEAIDVRLKWRAIDAVEDLGWIVLFRYGQQNVFIPSRVFSDDAARQAFVAATAARIKAAAESNRGPNQAWPA
jgi:hypothetical protein